MARAQQWAKGPACSEFQRRRATGLVHSLHSPGLERAMLITRIVRRLLARSSSGLRSSWPKLLVALVVLLALPALAYWRGFGLEQSDLGANASEMVVERLDPSPNKINLVLKEKSG